MRLRTRFFLFAAFIHVIMALLAIFLFQYNKLYFLLSEGLIIISIFITINLYRSFVKPLNIKAAGMESLKEKDFSIKFVNTGQYEIDQLIEVYNKMIEQLREERIEVNEQHYFLEKLIKASPSGILILDYDNKIQSANPAALEILGMPSKDLLGKNPEEIPAKFMSNFANVVKLPEVKKEENELHSLINNIVLLFSDVCERRNIEIKMFLDGDIFQLAFDAPQIEQVLINIIKNSIESIEEKGQIEIITNRNENRFIIRDSGKGIDNNIKDKLFSPFFSNKKEGQGIGLTLIKEILHNHNFTFSLDTKKDGLTEFVINFSATTSLIR